MTISFFVQGLPKAMSVGKTIRAGALSFQKRANTEWATLVGHIGRQHAPAVPLDGAVAFTAVFYVPRPATAAKKVVMPVKRPDIDNLIHKLSDQFNGVFWKDDSQIVDFHARKRFAYDGRTGAEFIVTSVEARSP